MFAYCVNTCSWATAATSLVLATEMAYEPAPLFLIKKIGEISPKTEIKFYKNFKNEVFKKGFFSIARSEEKKSKKIAGSFIFGFQCLTRYI